MKPELDKSDKNWLEWHKKNNPVIKFIRNKSAISFQPGDILIKEEKFGEEWRIVPVSPKSQVAKKYMFMYEDEYGIGYVKQLKAETAEYVHSLTCLASIDHDRIRFQVDPEYATHILINGEGTYDHSVEYKLVKERREKVRAENIKLQMKPNRFGSDLSVVFSKLSIGDKFWIAEDLGGTGRKELEVTAKNDKQPDVYGGTSAAVTVKEDSGATRMLTVNRSSHLVFFKSKPLNIKDML
jgi:hypothetical protein